MTALSGTYSWQRKNTDGTFAGIEADSARAHWIAKKTTIPTAGDAGGNRYVENHGKP